jgi:signal transduction histidine kinase
MKNLHELGTALLHDHDLILQRWREQVRTLDSAKHLDTPTLNDHIPGWLRMFAGKLLAFGHAEAPTAATGPVAHGVQRFDDGFDIEEVVAEYNILRECVYEFAEQQGLEIRGDSRRVIDGVFDESTGLAVKSFAESQAHEVERRRVEHLAFVVHDLRTPLSAITFAAAILERRIPPETRDADTARLLKTLARNARQLDALVTHVLQENTQLLTELGVKVERRTFDFWPVVESLFQDLQALADKSATRLVNAVPDDLDLTADATLVRRILQNLVTNALEYAPGGTVTIGARDPGNGQPVECWVSDNGAGIPASRIDSVFKPLETDPGREGIGLGLAIVKTFVEAHHGTVTVESVEGRGATFRFSLPRAVPVAEATSAVSA